MSRRPAHLISDTRFGFIDSAAESELFYHPQLVANSDGPTMLDAINFQLKSANSFLFSVAFITSEGIAAIKEALVQARDHGRGTIITSRYQDFNDPDDLEELLTLDNVDVYIADERRGFHAKGYVFSHDDVVTAIVGSSNLTMSALKLNEEWNLQFSSSHDGDIAAQLDEAIKRQLNDAVPLTSEWIEFYRNTRRKLAEFPSGPTSDEPAQLGKEILPNVMQANALEELREVREAGEDKALIISATGTGKTILAALAAKQIKPQRMLFIVHSEQILRKASSEFQKVLHEPDDKFGFLVGGQRDTGATYLFASIQSISRPENIGQFARSSFDLIIIDEVHRSGAKSYRTVIDYFRPDFLLGLTATPERTDGFNVYELFDFNVPYEIRLKDALEANMLAPFHFYGVSDYESDQSSPISDESGIDVLVSDGRVDYIVQILETYGFPRNFTGLIFCSRTEEAELLSQKLNQRSVHGTPLRTAALTGKDSAATRQETVSQLVQGSLNYILTVDIFNEGIDIPPLNQIVMLRGTESSIIFTQQLGRGLRKSPGKDHVRVIDFIGNYANNYLIPIALTGDRSGNKESTRRKLLNSNQEGNIPGASTISFDRISQDRVLRSLESARLDGLREFKEAIQELTNRLNQIPELADFARFELTDPVALATRREPNYWALLKRLKFVEQAPAEVENRYLKFLSKELLNGKRPHELLLLQLLIEKQHVSRDEFQGYLESRKTTASEAVIESVERILTLEFYTQPERTSYGNLAVILRTDDGYSLDPDFAGFYFSYDRPADRAAAAQTFRGHVDDIIHTGLLLCRRSGLWDGQLQIGNRYSRKDVCRVMNWKKNENGTINGYKVDKYTATCPIFVTYEKHPDTSASVQYDDSFKSPRNMRWSTRSGTKMEHKSEKAIIANEVPLYLFVKKHDSEGSDFYYLGEVRPQDASETTMPGGNGDDLNVVHMDLVLESPVEQNLYDYLSTPSAIKND